MKIPAWSLVLLYSSACAAPELSLSLPDPPLSGETVGIEVSGDFQTLELHIDQYQIDSGPGPLLQVTWDATVVIDGPHTFRGVGITEAGDTVEEEQVVEVINSR